MQFAAAVVETSVVSQLLAEVCLGACNSWVIFEQCNMTELFRGLYLPLFLLLQWDEATSLWDWQLTGPLPTPQMVHE